MAPFYRERNAGESKRHNMGVAGNGVSGLGSPFGELGVEFSHSELRETAYEIFVATCRPSAGKPLSWSPQYQRSGEREMSLSPSPSPVSFSSTYSPASSSPLQRSLTSSAASTVKKALGLKSSKKSPYKDGSPARSSKRPTTVSELMRIQMGISEERDSQIRRALLRIAAGQIGKQIEAMVLPLEFLQQSKASDFLNPEEYEAWKVRNLKVLEAGLLLHPLVPLEKNDSAAGRLCQVLKGASERPTEIGKNSESMQALRSTVMPLACRSLDGYPTDTCHWADGLPLNLMLYQILLEACFDGNDKCALIEELNEVLNLLKKSWLMLGINQMLHNLCFSWVLFNRFIATGQVESSLLFASENQLAEVAKNAKAIKDPLYANILKSSLSSMLGWTEKRLLAYHDTFQADTIDLMQNTVALGISAAKILVEDISSQYHRRRREGVDVSRNRVEAYIRSSIRTAFAQKMEVVDSSRRSYGNPRNPPPPVLSVLALDICDLVKYEKEVFSPVLKKWHPLAAGVAAATLHACYGSELKQFLSGITELTPDAVEVLKSADNLEKELVNIAVEDSVDSEDGGKGIIREMPPYEAESVVASLAKTWIKLRAESLREWVDSNLQQEAWNPRAETEQFAPSLVEVIHMMDETVEAFFHLPIPMHQDLIPHLVSGLDQGLQHYISKAKSGCGTKSSFVPTLPALTRCTTGSKLGVFKRKEKLPMFQRKKSQVGIMNGGDSFGLSQLCIRMNTLHQICTELEILERRIISHLRNGEFTDMSALNGEEAKFELALASCHEGIQQLCEATAYKVVFCSLNHLLWEGLYVGEPASSRVEPLLRELEQNLELVASTVHTRVRVRALTALMKASFDGFLLVLLAGGPSRAFSRQDCQLIEEDFRLLKQLYLVDGDGLPQELIETAAILVTNILPLFHEETEDLVKRYKRTVAQVYGSSISKITLPPTPNNWSPSDPNTVLRVLCHRNDKAAIKFLKNTYGLPKKL
ncbi:protein unc-13 homolog [Nymphaea colorata]|nr:protein unc-13 homolog [Nymphaea colorata]